MIVLKKQQNIVLAQKPGDLKITIEIGRDDWYALSSEIWLDLI